MRAGFDFVENTRESNRVYRTSNWTDAIAHWPMRASPGESYGYATIATHLLAAVLQHATGRTLLDFGREVLFEPLGIHLRGWTLAPEGVVLGGSEWWLTPREMAVFGQLYLQRGHWRGRSLVPADWVNQSTRMHVGPWSDGDKSGYGYLWWLADIGGYPSYSAEGYGGQFVFVIPDLDSVIVVTSTPITIATPFWIDHAGRRHGVYAFVARELIPRLQTRRRNLQASTPNSGDTRSSAFLLP